MRDLVRRPWTRALLAVATGTASLSAVVTPALAADTVAPVVAPGAFAAPPNGNNNWRITAPQTLTLSATDDVAVSKFQYSLDGGATYVDVPVTAGPTATANVPLSQEGNTTVRYRAVDSSGNLSRGATTNTTLNQASAAGATAVRLTSTTGRGAGDSLLIDTGAGQETATIATIVTPAPAAPAPNVTLVAPLVGAHAANAVVAGTAFYNTIALLIDTKGPVATWGTAATTLQAAAASGATEARLASLTGRAVGDVLQLDQGPNAETVKIATIPNPPPAAPAANVTFTSALTKNHLNAAAVYVPQVIDGKILQSQSLTPLRTDPRLNDPTDTVSNGAGGSAPRRMTLDGAVIIPKTVPLNRLTVGKHVTTVAVQDTAGSTLKYTNTFVVTTSFADLATVIDMDADNALRTTLNGATVVGATGLRLATPFGFRAGQTIVVDSGANAETVTLSNVPSPPPVLSTTLTARGHRRRDRGPDRELHAERCHRHPGPDEQRPDHRPADRARHGRQPGDRARRRSTSRRSPRRRRPNVVLSAPLTKDHASGAATTLANVILSAPLTKAHATGVTIANPQPVITDAKRTELKGLLADAKTKADASDTAGAIAALNAFKTAAAGEPALASSAQALIDQLQGKPVDTTGTGVAVGPADPGDQAIRQYWNPTVPAPVPGATYKVLVNGRAGGFRHQTIVDFEYMVQKMGQENGFDVDIWDPSINGSPGRQAPAGVSLTTSPFLDLATLKQYKTLVFDSTVGINGTATINGVEFANLQQYIRDGGGIVFMHGGVDSMQNVPWMQDLIGSGFTNHGSNQGGILIETESGGHVEYVTADRAHAATSLMPARFNSVEELYNTNRNVDELGIAHPLLFENEDSLVNQLGYSPGPLMNSDRHPMVWCRNFDGGRSFTSTLGHNWAYTVEPWHVSMILNAIQWTAGSKYANCVTFNEVKDLLTSAVASGGVNAAGNTALSAPLAAADAAHRAGNDAAAATAANQFVAQAKRVANCGCADGGKALLELQSKGVELANWMSGNEVAPPAAKFTQDATSGPGGTVPATLSLVMGAPATFGVFTPGVAKDYTATTTATVISTAGDATLSVADPSSTNTGKLVNGAFTLPQVLQANGGGAFAAVGGSASPTALKTWSAPTSNEPVIVTFKQSVGANDALRTGTYSKTLTFTLSTTTP